MTVPQPEKKIEEIKPVTKQANTCNCFLWLVDTFYPQLRTVGTNHIWRNLTDEVSDIVVFKYNSGIEHFGKVQYYDDEVIHIIDSNFKSCEVTERVIDRNDPSIKGFYKVDN